MNVVERAAERIYSFDADVNPHAAAFIAKGLAAEGLLVSDDDRRWREHSVILNNVAWGLHDAIGQIPKGAYVFDAPSIEEIMPEVLRLIALGKAAIAWRRCVVGGLTMDGRLLPDALESLSQMADQAIEVEDAS